MLSINALIVPLLGVSLFKDLKPLQLKALALNAERSVFEPGETLIERGQFGTAAYLIIHGSVAVTDNMDATLESKSFSPGTLIGEMAMLVETEHFSTVTVGETVRVLAFHRSTMHRLMQEDQELAAHFAEQIRLRLSEFGSALRIASNQMGDAHSQIERLEGNQLAVGDER